MENDPISVSGRSGLAIFTRRARTKGPQVIVGVDPRTVPVVPAKLDGIISHGSDLFQFRAGNGNKSSLRSMPLAKRARTITAEIFFRVFPHMAIVPCHPYDAAGFDMIDFSGIVRFHN